MMDKRFHSTSPLDIPTLPPHAAEQVATREQGANSFLPILMLCLASNLMVLGLLQLLFSDGGLLRLEWDSSYWFIYCAGALPLFLIGMKRLKPL
jgi:hypothetical protein